MESWKQSDRLPHPYANEAATRFDNGRVYPPDLSLITKVIFTKFGENVICVA